MIQNILNANFTIPNTISSQARSFLYCMLKKDGIDRLTTRQLLNHEFIKEKNNINIKQNIFNYYNYNYPSSQVVKHKKIDNNKISPLKTNIIFKDFYKKNIITNIVIDNNTRMKD